MNERERYRAVSLLGEPTRERLLELVAALADDGEYEEPGDPGAPPFYFCVASQASDTLAGHACEVLDELAQVMREHPIAAQQGARLLPACGDAGARLLLEVLQGPHVWGRREAVQHVRAQLRTCSDSSEGALVIALFEALADPDSGVAYQAVSEVGYLLKDRPELSRLAPAELVGRLVERMRAAPTAGTRAEALRPFGDRPGVLEAWVDLAVAGAPTCASLLRGCTGRLSQSAIDRLCQGPLNPQLIMLLGDLGERARAAAPRLRELLPEPGAAMALARLGIDVEVAEIFLAQTDYRVQEQLVLSCREPEKLASQVLPRLRERWENEAKEASVLWAVRAFRQHAESELPWLLQLLVPFGKENVWCWVALDTIAWFGEAARPAFGAMARLLDYSDHRGPVLKALQKLGPVAREEFLPLLEVLELESKRWLVWERNWWANQLQATLAALRS